MVTGFDYLSKDKALQEHWLRRFVAIVIDWLVIWIPFMVFFSVLSIAWFSFMFIGIPGAAFFLYCAFFEYVIGGTVGKMLMRLKVVALSGKLDIAQALLRNISKIFWPLLLLDWIIGMAIDTQDPRQKWSDQLAKTSVMLY
ncbi:MAG: hypothetical protein A3K76_01840 [Euryarchaeota archaeon RBG_13_57_23]|nr:MAG: hypothetical protein A3K69_07515 [Candidatus Bathyarchaeota archaeon RBG_16_57_9]OGS45055.1 MAG: hypothetical protein A3K76_01840 [Euryarchaeota archaeon RBG_13_57_23]